MSARELRNRSASELVSRLLHANNMGAVSYTHLDVYKRQVPMSGDTGAGICPSLGCWDLEHRSPVRSDVCCHSRQTRGVRTDVYKRQVYFVFMSIGG